jgi:hypothetical protein
MSQRGRIRRKDNGNSTFSMPSSKVTVKDMRIGQFDYELEEVLPTPIFHVQKDGIWSTNFLFSCLQEHLSDMVLVENEVCTINLTLD